jgi:hypothetical protein
VISIFCNSRDGNDANTGASAGDAVQSVPVALAKIRALLTITVVDVELLFYGENGVRITYNFEATQYWTEADAHAAGKRVRFGAYGTGTPYWTACDRVSGWEADSGSTNPRIVRAPLTGSHCDVWLEDGTPLVRSRLGRFNDYYRIELWEPGTVSVIISTALVPYVQTYSGMVMAIQMGWALSYLRVADIVPATVVGYSDVSRVTFEAEGVVEFAKADGGLGSLFPFGPFHNDLGQRFWWENKEEFLVYETGQWWHNTNTGQLYVHLPSHIEDAAALDALGVFVSNGLSTLFAIGSSADGLFVEGFDLEDIGVMRVGYNLPASEGYIGYGVGLSFYNNAGTIAFHQIPPAILIYRSRSVGIRRNYFREIGGVAFGSYYGLSDIDFDGNAFARIGACAVVFNAVKTPFSGMEVEDQATRLRFTNNVAFDTGYLYVGTCFVIGPWNYARVLRNRVSNCTDDAFAINTGARLTPMWTRDILVMDNDVDTVMTMTTDGGAFYASGNLNGRHLVEHTPVHPTGPCLRFIRNRVRNVRRSGYDPGGGHVGCFYPDLGSEGVIIAQNYAENCDLFFLENCSLWNTVVDNCLIDVDEVDRIFYSGFNDVRDTEEGLETTTYLPPLNNPPNADDIAKFNGTGLYVGRAFKDVIPFPTIQHCFKGTTQDYESLSSRFNNGPFVKVNMAHVGPDAATLARFPELLQ